MGWETNPSDPFRFQHRTTWYPRRWKWIYRSWIEAEAYWRLTEIGRHQFWWESNYSLMLWKLSENWCPCYRRCSGNRFPGLWIPISPGESRLLYTWYSLPWTQWGERGLRVLPKSHLWIHVLDPRSRVIWSQGPEQKDWVNCFVYLPYSRRPFLDFFESFTHSMVRVREFKGAVLQETRFVQK